MLPEDLEQLMFELCYVQHGGSGLGFTLQDVLGLDVAFAERMAERLLKRRKEEVDAINRANRRGRKK